MPVIGENFLASKQLLSYDSLQRYHLSYISVTTLKTECSITFKESNNHLIDPQSLAVSMAKRLGIMLRSFLFLLAIGSISAKK